MDIIRKTGRQVYDIDGHIGYEISVSSMNTLLKAWSKNRQLDNTRVNELSRHLKQGGWVPPTIHVAHIPVEGLVCYDGNHRREAYRQISPCFENKTIILDILKKPTEIYKCFNDINKSVPVAQIDLLMDNDFVKIRHELDNLVKKYEKTYSSFVSTSSRCNTPNFNRDNFKDQLFQYIQNKEYQINIQIIEEALNYLNNAYAKDIRSGADVKNLRATVLKKCREENLWLFAWKRDIPFEDIEWAINQNREQDLIVL